MTDCVDPSRASTGIGAELLPAVLDLLARVGDALVATLGPHTEVVVHDLRHPEHSIVAISGDLTGRRVGAPIPDPDLLPEALERFTADDLRRSTTTQSGRELTSSTVWVRDATGRIIGGLCINVDESGLRLARDLIDQQLNSRREDLERSETRPLPTFAQDVHGLIRLAVQEEVDRSGKPRHRFNLADRTSLVRRLHEGGLLELRGSIGILADELGVSRATIYSYLKKSRAEQGSQQPDGPLLALVLGSQDDTASVTSNLQRARTARRRGTPRRADETAGLGPTDDIPSERTSGSALSNDSRL